MNGFVAAASVAFLCSLASLGAFARGQNAAADAGQQEAELARVGEETTERACRDCHPIEEIVSTRRTPGDWNDMVEAMAARGVTATDKELATVSRYLARYFGLVAVNRASAEDLSAVLGLSAQDAGRIVGYRTQNGTFADLAALLAVPGIDRMKIEEQPQALRFD